MSDRNIQVNQNQPGVPVKFAAMVSIVVTAVILVLVLSIGGSLYLSYHVAQQQKVAAVMFQRRAESFQTRASLPTCKALIEMADAAKSPPTVYFGAERDPRSYVSRLSSAINDIVANTHCRQIVRLLENGMPPLKVAHIVQREEEARSSH